MRFRLTLKPCLLSQAVILGMPHAGSFVYCRSMQLHEMEIEAGDRDRPVVETRPGKREEIALSGNGDDFVVHVDESPFLLE